MNLIPVTWYAIAALVLTEALTLGMWRHCASSYDAYKATVESAREAQVAHNKAMVDDQKKITEDTTNGWKAALDYVRAHPMRVLPKPGSSPQPGVSIPAGGVDDPGKDAVSTAGDVAQDCSETTLQLNWLQNWVERQVQVK